MGAHCRRTPHDTAAPCAAPAAQLPANPAPAPVPRSSRKRRASRRRTGQAKASPPARELVRLQPCLLQRGSQQSRPIVGAARGTSSANAWPIPSQNRAHEKHHPAQLTTAHAVTQQRMANPVPETAQPRRTAPAAVELLARQHSGAGAQSLDRRRARNPRPPTQSRSNTWPIPSQKRAREKHHPAQLTKA